MVPRQGVASVIVLALLPLPGCLGGGSSTKNPALTVAQNMTVASSAFAEGGTIPAKYSCKGSDVSPPLAFAGLPTGTRYLALIVDDPDAPRGTWTHWTFWNLPAAATNLAEDVDVTQPGAREGTTSAGSTGYHGPCPPSGTHRYFFKVYAQKEALDLASGATVNDLAAALEGKLLGWGQLMGKFSKP